jgi:hypothetical protein
MATARLQVKEVQSVALFSPVLFGVAASDTAAHTFASHPVSTPVMITMDPSAVGTVTISLVGVSAGVVLNAGKVGIFYVTDTNLLDYKFSSSAGTEKFGVSAGL